MNMDRETLELKALSIAMGLFPLAINAVLSLNSEIVGAKKIIARNAPLLRRFLINRMIKIWVQGARPSVLEEMLCYTFHLTDRLLEFAPIRLSAEKRKVFIDSVEQAISDLLKIAEPQSDFNPHGRLITDLNSLIPHFTMRIMMSFTYYEEYLRDPLIELLIIEQFGAVHAQVEELLMDEFASDN